MFCHRISLVKYFDWDEEKNKKLKEKRNVSFEDVVKALNEKRVLHRGDHPNQKRYPGQKIVIVKMEDYAYIVPFVEDDEKIFFKTIMPSRKATKRYLRKEENEIHNTR
ncbi:MAG: uncharacterized protein HW400_628 [Candidatus Levybacteria bacterium]|nr:uncharacterized protein [Candidatus Levybacteria bacterium]